MDAMLRDYRRHRGTSKLEIDVALHVHDASEVHFNISEDATLHAVRQFPSEPTESLGRTSEHRLGFNKDASALLQGRALRPAQFAQTIRNLGYPNKILFPSISLSHAFYISSNLV